GGVLSLAGTSDPSGISRLLIATRYSPGGMPGALSRLPASVYLPDPSVLPVPPKPGVPSLGMNVTVAFARGWPSAVTVPLTGTSDGSADLSHPHRTATVPSTARASR